MTDAVIKGEPVEVLRTDIPALPTVKFAIDGEKSNGRDQGITAAVPKISHWTKLAKLRRLHLLASAASGVPYDPKLLEKSVVLRGIEGEDSDTCRVDMGASRRQSMSGHRSAVEDEDDEGDDEGAPTASSNTYIKSAIPYLPRRVAILCLMLNIIIPGTGM